MAGVVGSRDLLLVLIIVILHLLLLPLLCHLLLRVLRGLLGLGLGIGVGHVDVHFVLFLVAVNLLAIVHIDSQVEWLIFHLVALDIGSFRLGTGPRGLRRCRYVCLHRLTHFIVSSCWHRVSFFLTIELISKLDGFSALLGKIVLFTIHFLFVQKFFFSNLNMIIYNSKPIQRQRTKPVKHLYAISQKKAPTVGLEPTTTRLKV